MPKIDLINITKRWGDFYAVDNLNLHIDDRSFITLLGPSGCGKTTTLRMIAGLETPTSGKILINGLPVFDSDLGINVPASKRHVGFLFQNYALWPHMTVYKNIAFGLKSLKDEMPVVISDYYVSIHLVKILKEPRKIVDVINSNKTKDGKIDERRALIALVDEFTISIYSAKYLFNFKFNEKNDDEIKLICEEEIKKLTTKSENIVQTYENKGYELDEKGFLLGEPTIDEEALNKQVVINILKDKDSLMETLKEIKGLDEESEFAVKYNCKKSTASSILKLKLDDINDEKELETKINLEIEMLNNALEIMKSTYLNKGYLLNEKFELIPKVDVENKEWDHKLVHILKDRKLDREEIELRIRHVSRVVKIGEFMDRYPSELSGGQQQRVAIARTLAPGPKVLFMDEPLSNLDAKLRLEMRGELKRLHLDTNSTFVYVTHDQLEAMTLATKICLIDNGVLQQYDAPLDVYKKPNNLFVADFVGNPAINFVEVKAKQGDNKIELTMFDDTKMFFVPNKSLDLAKLAKKRDEEFKKEEDEIALLKANKKFVEKGNKDRLFNFRIQKISETQDSKDEKNITDDEYVIGIRPEFLHVEDNGEINGEIYNALPSGMETTVKIRVGEYLLTSVIFGGVDYKIGSKCKLSFIGKEILLFDRKSGKLLSVGSLKIK